MGDYEQAFRRLFWIYGIVGAIAGIVGAGAVVVLWRLLQDHWR